MVARSENVATRKLKNAFEINAAFFTFRVFRQGRKRRRFPAAPTTRNKRPAPPGVCHWSFKVEACEPSAHGPSEYSAVPEDETHLVTAMRTGVATTGDNSAAMEDEGTARAT